MGHSGRGKTIGTEVKSSVAGSWIWGEVLTTKGSLLFPVQAIPDQTWLPRGHPVLPHLWNWGPLPLGRGPLSPSFIPTRASRCGDRTWLLLSPGASCPPWLLPPCVLPVSPCACPSVGTPVTPPCLATRAPSASHLRAVPLSSEPPAKSQNRMGIQ